MLFSITGVIIDEDSDIKALQTERRRDKISIKERNKQLIQFVRNVPFLPHPPQYLACGSARGISQSLSSCRQIVNIYPQPFDKYRPLIHGLLIGYAGLNTGPDARDLLGVDTSHVVEVETK